MEDLTLGQYIFFEKCFSSSYFYNAVVDGVLVASSPGCALTMNPRTKTVLLPSGLTKSFTKGSGFLGKPFQMGFIRRSVFSGVKLQVRGIAKNPVDHPNGGRANTKGSFKTPWGL